VTQRVEEKAPFDKNRNHWGYLATHWKSEWIQLLFLFTQGPIDTTNQARDLFSETEPSMLRGAPKSMKIHGRRTGCSEGVFNNLALLSWEWLEGTLRSYAAQPLRSLVGSVIEEAKKFVAGAPQADDLTIITVRYRG
jgi:hypothetical protein